jgi:hypothetical protein
LVGIVALDYPAPLVQRLAVNAPLSDRIITVVVGLLLALFVALVGVGIGALIVLTLTGG